MEREQTSFCKFTSCVRHIVSLTFCIFDKQRYLPQDLAESRTGDITKEELENSKAFTFNMLNIYMSKKKRICSDVIGQD